MKWLLALCLALIPMSLEASETTFTEDDAFVVAEEVVSGQYEEFFRMDSAEKGMVISVLRGMLSEAEFEELRDAYLGAVYAERDNRPNANANCPWWTSLGQGGRNYQIVVESLYAVDTDIWGQNSRMPCNMSSYLTAGCCLMGDWNYMGRGDGKGGQCKVFSRQVLERASGGAASLPHNDVYDYRPWYPWRNRTDGIRYAQAGELMQFTGAALHTAQIVTNFGDGRFEVVDSNWCGTERIAKHVIYANSESLGQADLKFYVIDCY